jgi:outer membrane protein assembly factor BamA
MRTAALFGTMLVLATASVAAQTATGIHLADVRFSGDTQLDAVDLSKCTADPKSRTYEGPEWQDDLVERVRVLCLQDNGYFKATVKPSVEQLPDKESTHQFVITFDIAAGPMYRTGQIAFRNNHVFSAEELHSMFNVESGDNFSPRRYGRRLSACVAPT